MNTNSYQAGEQSLVELRGAAIALTLGSLALGVEAGSQIRTSLGLGLWSSPRPPPPYNPNSVRCRQTLLSYSNRVSPARNSTTTMPPSSKPKRARNETQLSRKRLVDRVKHQENRQKQKGQLERMESDIADIRQSLRIITDYLNPLMQSYNLLHPLNVNQHDMSPALNRGPSHSPPSSFLSPHSVQPAPIPSRLLDCRCGMRHSDHFESLELCGVTGVYQNRVAFPQAADAVDTLPRNPTLPNMMLHSEGDNFITSLITPFLRDLKAGSMETLLGGYLFAYRLIRVRPFPLIIINWY